VTTRIFDLPVYGFAMTVGNNEDWRDSWPYVNPDTGIAIPLTGIALDFTLMSIATGALVVVASTGTSVGGLPLNGRVASGGTAGNVVGLNIPRATMLRVPVASAGYAYELQARADAVTKTIARGSVTILEGQAP
jgi:hypothetical protein